MHKQLLTAIALAAATVAAWATVTFNPADGTGFVGKGDVQVAFAWNNAQLQSNAAQVSFTYTATDTYAFTCEWWTGPTRNRTQHFRDHQRTIDVTGTVNHEARRSGGSQPQVTGFSLTGFGSGAVGESGGVPQVGAPCPGFQGNDAIVVAVTAGPVGSVSALMVNHPTRTSVKIWPLPSL
jgi:hypothetical protein